MNKILFAIFFGMASLTPGLSPAHQRSLSASTEESTPTVEQISDKLANQHNAALNAQAETLKKFERDFKAEKINADFATKKQATYKSALKVNTNLAGAKLTLDCKTTLCRLEVVTVAQTQSTVDSSKLVATIMNRPLIAVEKLMRYTEPCAFSIQPALEAEGFFGSVHAQIDCSKNP